MELFAVGQKSRIYSGVVYLEGEGKRYRDERMFHERDRKSSGSAMIEAICSKCGEVKQHELDKCDVCGKRPETLSEVVTAIAMSKKISPQEDLIHFSLELRNKGSVDIDVETLKRAGLLHEGPIHAIAEEDLSPVKRRKRASSSKTSASENVSSGQPSDFEREKFGPKRTEGDVWSGFSNNPFYVLGLHTDSTKAEVISAAENCALSSDAGDFDSMRAALLNPRLRLPFELSWLLGVTQEEISEFKQLNDSSYRSLFDGIYSDSVGLLNMMSAFFAQTKNTPADKGAIDFIKKFAEVYQNIDLQTVEQQLRVSRAASGMQVNVDSTLLKDMWDAQKRSYLNAVRNFLDRLPSEEIILVITQLSEHSCSGEASRQLHFIDEIVNLFELETVEFFDKEEAIIYKTLNEIEEKAKKQKIGASKMEQQIFTMSAPVFRLKEILENWEKVARPLIILHERNGTTYKRGETLGRKLRSTAIDIYNKRQLHEVAILLTKIFNEVFCRINGINTLLERDFEAFKSHGRG